MPTVKSSKAKGRLLQQYVRDKILDMFPFLVKDTDVRSAIMGEQGEDIKLSPKARAILPVSIECKSLAKIAVYSHYEQAMKNAPKGVEPLVVLKANRKKPLVLMDLDHYMEFYRGKVSDS